MAKRKKNNRTVKSTQEAQPEGRQGPKIADNLTFHQEIYESPQYPPPDIFNAYSEEVQQWLMQKVDKEQDKRHEWTMLEQQHRHDHQMRQLKFVTAFVILGQVLSTSIALASIAIGGWLIHTDKNIEGFGAFLIGVAILVGTAIWRRNAENSRPESKD